MSALVIGLALVVAITTAVRSIWSPCGLSMLSTITPMAEAGWGHSFRSTSVWFVLGSVAGGLTLGGLMAGIAFAAESVGVDSYLALGVVSAASLVTSASDARLGGFHLPGHDRQVNERWLDRYRSWVYGAGFGWQIGVGLATYIMTAGVYLLVLTGGLSADPVAALCVGALFGLVRGLAVYLAAGLNSIEKLHAFHARFEAMRDPVRQGTIMIQALVAISAATAAGADTPILGTVIASAVLTVAAGLRAPREAVYLRAPTPVN